LGMCTGLWKVMPAAIGRRKVNRRNVKGRGARELVYVC